MNEDDQKLKDKIIDIIAEEGKVERAKLLGSETLDDIGLDSIEVVMILNGIEDEFDIYIPVDQNISSGSKLDDLIELVIAKIKSKD